MEESLRPTCDTSEATISITGRVKWFDVTRGFGFVVADDPALSDVLMHVSMLKVHNRRSLPEGARVEALVVEGARGLQVCQITTIDLSQAVVDMAVPRPRQDLVDSRDMIKNAGPFETATVKWFNQVNGYGFLVRDCDGANIFIHMEVLRRGGIETVEPGQPVLTRIFDSVKGALAVVVKPVIYSPRP